MKPTQFGGSVKVQHFIGTLNIQSETEWREGECTATQEPPFLAVGKVEISYMLSYRSRLIEGLGYLLKHVD